MKNASLLEKVTTLVTIVGIALVWWQLRQANKHKRWDNYNTMNTVYRQMFVRLQDRDYRQLRKNCSDYDKLGHQEKAWVRSYYNLYAQEFDLNSAKLLPKNMMDETISRGFRLNLKTYPSIAEGFKTLVDEKAFGPNTSFVKHVNNEINEAGKLPMCEKEKSNQVPTYSPPKK